MTGSTKNIRVTTLEEFYKEASLFMGKDVAELLPPNINKEIGHFNVFDIASTIEEVKRKKTMPYNRRAYYKISLIRGKSVAEYADKVIDIEHNALLFATPRVPYHWIPKDEALSGSFCIFTDAFLSKNESGRDIDDLPIFRAGGYPVFHINDEQANEIAFLYRKMQLELASDYEYKYDMLRNCVLELIHYGQKLQPVATAPVASNGHNRIISLFIELLERQFPIDTQSQRLELRSAKDYADRLAIHVNHLNKVLKEATGKTTTDFISGRIAQEAKILLKQTDWNISEIAYSLGFEEVAHFSNFFRKQASLSPAAFRQ